MTRFSIALTLAAALFAGVDVQGCDLTMTIRGHTDRLMFGDPLYVEITLTNPGDVPVAGIVPSPDLGSLEFTITEWQGHLTYAMHLSGALAGAGTPEIFEPGKPRTYYFTLLLPKYSRYDHIFWERFQSRGDTVIVQAIYNPRWLSPRPPEGISLAGSGQEIRSTGHTVHIEPRPESQMERLRFWAKRDAGPAGFQKGPDFGEFFLPLGAVNREEMGRIAFDMLLDGELGGLVMLSMKFRDIYELPPESRDAANRELVEWLRKEPDWKRVGEVYMVPGPGGGLERVRLHPEVKRQVLLRHLRILAASHNMPSTFQALGGGDREIPDLVPQGEWSEETPEDASRSERGRHLAFSPKHSGGAQLEIDIQPHVNQIVFGDPVYVQTTIENRGHKAFLPLPELQKKFGVILRIDDGNADVEAIAYPRGEVQLDRLEPGEQRVLYCYAFLPGWYRYGNGFWKRVREGRRIRIRGAYRMTSDGVEVTGPWHNVLVRPRAENEITALGSWINAEGRGTLGSFSPGHFGIVFRHTLDREQMRELASDVPSGELGDLFRMARQFCDLQQSPPSAREAGNRELVEWLRKQPDVKRAVLLRELKGLADQFDMLSTAEALTALIEDG